MNAYTYLIGWTDYNLFYYGSRTAKDCDPKDLWVTYFTSSKSVCRVLQYIGDPDVIVVRKTFGTDSSKCLAWEHKVLRRLQVRNNPNFLNIAESGNNFCSSGYVTVYKGDICYGQVSLTDERLLKGEFTRMKDTTRAWHSNRMLSNNPMKDSTLAQKVANKKKALYERGLHGSTSNKTHTLESHSKRMISNNPMKNPETVKRMLANRDPKSSGKGMKWMAQPSTKERKRVMPSDVQKFVEDGWILLGNKLPIPTHIQLSHSFFEAETPASDLK